VVAATAAAALALGGTGLWIGSAHAGVTANAKDRRAVAEAALDHWTKSPRTPAATRALRQVADRPLFGGDDAVTFAKARPHIGGDDGDGGGTLANIRVNDPALDKFQTDQTTQSETTIAVVGKNVVVGYNDSQQALLAQTNGIDLSGYAYSVDGGATFTDAGTIPNLPNFMNIGDPWLAADRAGNVYYSTLAFGGDAGNLEIGVAKSTNGGKTFSAPVIASPNDATALYQGDKDALTVGRSVSDPSKDVLYDAWDDFSCTGDFSTCTNGLPVARSSDGGATWTIAYADKFVADPSSCSFAQYIGAQPLVDPKTGTLYVASEKFSADDPTCSGTASVVTSEVLFTSTDGGQTFGPGVTIATITPASPTGALNVGPGQFIRTVEFPTIALAGSKLVVAWNDGESGNSHIRMATSSDGGATWTTDWVTTGTGDEIQPALTSDRYGLHLLYYQRNADNTIDVNVANGNGHGWSTKTVTSRSFPGVVNVPQFDPQIAFGYMGDYIANVSDGSRSYFAWGDNRNKVINFTHPQGRNDPDVYFAKQ
jgi:hypothetical protein